MKRIPYSFILASILLFTRTGRAETITLSLREAVGRALADGTAVRIAAESVGAARADTRIARASLLPTLETSVSGSDQITNFKTFGFIPPGSSNLAGPFSTFDARISAAAKLIDVAALRRYQASRHSIAVSDRDREATENDVAAAVATLYVSMQRAGAKVEQAKANVTLFEKLRDLAKDQEKAGVAIRVDTLRAEVQLAREKQALVVAQNDLDAARLGLLHAIGADLGTEVRLSDPLHEVDPAFTAAEEALSVAEATRPELGAFRERVRAANLRTSAAWAERLPTIGVQAFASANGNGPNDLDATYTAGGVVSMPIFSGGRIEGEVAAARAAASQADLRQIEIRRQIAEEVRRSLLAYQSAKSRVGLAAENANLARAELDVARDRFSNGLSTSIEVDNAQTAMSAAENARIDALADEAQAIVDMQRATGTIRDLLPSGTR